MQRIYFLRLPNDENKTLIKLQNRWTRMGYKKRDAQPRWSEQVWRGKLRSYLHKIQFGKCAYCETKVANASNGHVEHYWPKKRYFKYKFVWTNWLLACYFCNTEKGTTDTKRVPWINPKKDEPIEYFNVLPSGKIIPKRPRQKKAKNTIYDTDLNCEKGFRADTLKETRKSMIAQTKKLLNMYLICQSASSKIRNEALDALVNHCADPGLPHSGIAFIWLANEIQTTYPNLVRLIGTIKARRKQMRKRPKQVFT